MMPGAGGDVNVTLPFVLSIIEIVLCCNVVFGGVGLLFALQAKSALGAGDIETARSKAKLSMIIVVVGAVLETVGVALNILAGLARN
jgi:hypothetical protein